uniref:EGF-like domain-containing protein n=1 Tax=Globisporangium ultimum (strain ATCC 200006 / CBS 805.95 / DAOM BR144) TaxID=431595 RepID=K3XCD4_GLOUD
MVCHCHDSFTGYDCSGIICPKGKAWGVITGVDRAHELVGCSGRGYCSYETGVCQCQQGFHGDACQFTDCPDGCMSRGKCISMKERAQNEVLSRELYDRFEFIYNDVWDNDMILGCACDDIYSGPNCALKKCPVGDDPLTTGQANEVQLVQCLTSYQQQTLTLRFDAPLTQGTFLLLFGKQYTRPISFNALASLDSNGLSIASSLLALTGVTGVTVTRSGSPPTQADWQINFPTTNVAQNAVLPRWKVLEVQQFICAADAGVFSLTFGNDTISKIPYNADVNTFRTMLSTITFIGTLDITLSSGGTTICSATGTTYVTIKFTQLWDRNYFGDIPEITFSNLDAKGLVSLFLLDGDGFVDAEAKEVVKGLDSCRIIERQSFVCAATSGNFALTFEDGTRVANLPFDIAADLLEATIIASVPYIVDIDVTYSSDASVACTVAGTTITIDFVVVKSNGAKGDGDLAEVLADRTNGGFYGLNHISNRLKFPTTALTEVTRGVTCVPFDHSFSPNPTSQMVAPVQQGGGTFTVAFRGYTSNPIPATSTPNDVQQILQLLPTIQGVNVSHSGALACETPANVMSVTFTQNFGNLPTVVVDGARLVSGSNVTAFGGGMDVQGLVSIDGTKENAVCSGRGQCDDLKLGKCVCFLGYTNSNGNGELGNVFVNRGDCGCTSCIPVSCPGDLSCSGHGTCSGEPSYKCTCALGWQGGDCADRVCPSGASWFDYPVATNAAHRTMSECSGVGTCDRSSGVCKCPRPYTGTACELSKYHRSHTLTAPNIYKNIVLFVPVVSCGGSTTECSGNGQCLTLNALAPLIAINGENAGFSYGSDPNNPRTWDRHKVRSCLCDADFLGYDCSLRECLRGDDPSTYDDPIERQLLQCVATAGTFTLTFRDQMTAAIPFNANEAAIKSALESLSTIKEVQITFRNTAVACSTTQSVILIDFVSELGDLPTLKGSRALLRDNVNGNGQDGSGTLVFASRGIVLQGEASVTSTRENAFCSNHGKCDFTTGTCNCDDNYGSSNGKGGPGPIGDCGFHELKYAAAQ